MDVKKNKPSLIVSLFFGKLMTVGGWLVSIFAVLMIVMALTDLDGEGAKEALVVMIFMLGLGVLSILRGRKRTRFCNDFKRYAEILALDPTRSIDNLAARTNQSLDVVMKNLEIMRDKKYFPQVQIDYETRRLFFPSDELSPGHGHLASAQPPTNPSAMLNAQPASSPIQISCSGCGAINRVWPGQSVDCEFCGSALSAPHPVVSPSSPALPSTAQAPPVFEARQAPLTTADIENTLNSYRSRISDAKIHLAPTIPPKKSGSAIGAYAPTLGLNDIIVLVDSTLLGGADDGLIISRQGLFAHDAGEAVKYIPLSGLRTVTCSGTIFKVNGASFADLIMSDKKSIEALAEMVAAMFRLPRPSQVAG